MGQEILPFLLDVPEAELADLRRRLRQTRWPAAEPVSDWSQGVPLGYLRELCGYWADGYDWRAAEARLNALPLYQTEIDGLRIVFAHVRSPRPEGHRAADQSRRARGQRGGRVSRGVPVPARLRIQRPAGPDRLGRGADRPGLG